MGGEQAADVLLGVKLAQLETQGQSMSESEQTEHTAPILEKYEREGSAYYSTSRLWEYEGVNESYKRFKKALAAGFKDLARQLVEFPYGDGLDVVLGGGRRAFLPTAEEEEPEPPEEWGKGRRTDGRNLVRDWLGKPGTAYVKTREELLSVDTSKPIRLLGLFRDSHLKYEAELDPKKERTQPRLSEMATTALEVLRHNADGFFLMVEGGMIDKAHHTGRAYRALVETIEFDRAIHAVYQSLTDQEREETLIIVTADHSHTLTISGYPTRGNPILGKVYGNDVNGDPDQRPDLDELGLPYTTLSYANGPGATALTIDTKKFTTARGGVTSRKLLPLLLGRTRYIRAPVAPRPDLHDVDTEAGHFVQEGLVPMKLETHGGEDVVIYAKGPGSHLFRGTREQNYIFHAMQQALLQKPRKP